MPSHPTGDPLLKRADWRAAIAYWRASSAPCARCGGHIDRRSKTRGPDSLDVGHVVSRYEARRMGWTDEQINSLSNTQTRACRDVTVLMVLGSATPTDARPVAHHVAAHVRVVVTLVTTDMQPTPAFPMPWRGAQRMR
jgi:hypothetical protein